MHAYSEERQKLHNLAILSKFQKNGLKVKALHQQVNLSSTNKELKGKTQNNSFEQICEFT
jgi:hypothetical protein